MKNILRFTFILSVTILMQFCTAQPATEVADQETILDAYWMLISLEGQNVPAPKDSRMAYIRLQENEDDIFGFAGCNKFTGKYKLTEDALQLSELSTTRMSCTNMDTENKLMEALRSTTSYKKSGRVLTLYAGDKAVATFRSGNPNEVGVDVR
ncbi:META domain-containing protein [Pontibacter cellulosilyticus]|uniref:META domain-containing protein n=1 Tax=Pontibacter cellulosilyticus TaxID=1720253 RepID=A0A923N907_9BACT|nr:META domain-containing protein [Pontibacter cellulosilyticus]MBC5992645.1 META domain-containing protein [Pontibacter cellulosilyticus]